MSIHHQICYNVTALSSTEAEFFAAIAASKVVLFLCFVLDNLKFPVTKPTPFYEDNESCIKIINTHKPTNRVQHLEVPYFRIQDWKDNGYILLKHIPNILLPPGPLTKPLGWVLLSHHSRQIMGHHKPS